MVRLFFVSCALLLSLAAIGCGKSDDLPVTPTLGTIATLQGTVVASDTYVPVSGVSISIQGVRLTTGRDGTYAVSGLKPGRAILTADRTGFRTFVGQVTLEGAVTFNFMLAPQVLRGAGG